MIARFLGPDGETVGERAVQEPLQTHLRVPVFAPLRFTDQTDDSGLTNIYYREFVLTRIIPPEDGGPLAIYVQKEVKFR